MLFSASANDNAMSRHSAASSAVKDEHGVGSVAVPPEATATLCLKQACM